MNMVYDSRTQPYKFLSTSPKTAHISSQLQSGALIYIGKLCDYGSTVTFTVTYIKLEKKENYSYKEPAKEYLEYGMYTYP